MDKFTLAIDLGGTNTKFALVSKDLKIEREATVATNAHLDPKSACEGWLKALGIWNLEDIDLVGIGSPGPLDSKRGCILETPNLKTWAGFSFTDFLSSKLGAPAFLAHDSSCAALGEWSDSKVKDMIVLTLGTGVGVGVIIDDRLLKGATGLACEAGHMTINESGPRCGCGRQGCLEAYVGAHCFVNLYNERASQKDTALTTEEIFGRARLGEGQAIELVEIWTRALAIGIGNLINIFNPRAVILTGGVSRSFHQVEKQFRSVLSTQAFKSCLEACDVRVSQLQNKAGLIGAAVWATQQL